MNPIDRIHASIQARFLRPWMLKHFSSTAYGKALKRYKGRFAGRRRFLIGNGPSLRAEDLNRLHEAGEITFGFNRIYNIFDQTPWRPPSTSPRTRRCSPAARTSSTAWS